MKLNNLFLILMFILSSIQIVYARLEDFQLDIPDGYEMFDPKNAPTINVQFQYDEIDKAVEALLLKNSNFTSKDIEAEMSILFTQLSIQHDNTDFDVHLALNYLVNAYYFKQKNQPTPSQVRPKISVTLGLLALIKDYDTFAAIIGHELTHGNEEMLKPNQDHQNILAEEIENFLNTSIPDEFYSHREEFRADLGSVIRLIKAGLDPHAMIDCLLLIQKLENSEKEQSRFLEIINLFKLFLSHPQTSLRITIVKAFIQYLITKHHIDLSAHTQQMRTPMPPALDHLAKSINKNRKKIISLIIREAKRINAIKNPPPPLYKSIISGITFLPKLIYKKIQDFRKKDHYTKETLKKLIDTFEDKLQPYFHSILESEQIENVTYKNVELASDTLVHIIRHHSNSVKIEPIDVRRVESAVKYYLKVIHVIVKKFNLSDWKNKDDFLQIIRRINYLSTFFNQIATEQSLLEYRDLLDTIEDSLIKIYQHESTNPELETLIDNIQSISQTKMLLETRFKFLTLKKPTHIREYLEIFDSIQHLDKHVDRALNPFILSNQEKLFQLLFSTLNTNERSDYYSFIYYLSQAISSHFKNMTLQRIYNIQDNIHQKNQINNITKEILLDFNFHQILDETNLKNFFIVTVLSFNNLNSLLESTAGSTLIESTKRKNISDIIDFKEISQHLLIHHKNMENFLSQIKNLNDLKLFVQNLKSVNFPVYLLRNKLANIIIKNKHWIQTPEDVEWVLNTEELWLTIDPNSQSAFLARAYAERLQKKLTEIPKHFLYNSDQTHILHKQMVEILNLKSILANSNANKLKIWKKLATRGSSYYSDSIFKSIYESKTLKSNQKTMLNNYVQNGYVWDPIIRYKSALDAIQTSTTYQNLKAQKQNQRKAELEEVIELVKKLFPEKGMYYNNLLNAVSTDIQSSYEESKFIDEASKIIIGDKDQDLVSRMTSAIAYEAANASSKQQWELLLFLRGDLSQSDLFDQMFSSIGITKVKRAFDVLPPQYKAALIMPLFNDTKGLLGNSIDINSGYSKIILDYLLRNESKQTKKVSLEILSALFKAMQELKDHYYISDIYAYLLFATSGEENTGSILGKLLEYFGSIGIKIAQAIVAAEILSPEDTEALRYVQDRVLVPTRIEIFDDLFKIGGQELLDQYEILELLGAASMKYVVKARNRQTGRIVALKILREDAFLRLNSKIQLLDTVLKYLTKDAGSDYDIVHAIVNASKASALKELDLEKEAQRSNQAREEIYVDLNLGGYDVQIPKDEFNPKYQRLLVADYVDGVNIFQLNYDKAERASQAITKSEYLIHKRGRESNKEFLYEKDRHPGNILISKTQNILYELDFGQVTSIKPDQLKNVYNLFAISEVLKRSGTNSFLLNELKRIFELNENDIEKLKSALSKIFPNPELSPSTAYFKILGACMLIQKPAAFYFAEYPIAATQNRQAENLRKEPSSEILNQMSEVKVIAYFIDLYGYQKQAIDKLQSAFMLTAQQAAQLTQITSTLPKTSPQETYKNLLDALQAIGIPITYIYYNFDLAEKGFNPSAKINNAQNTDINSETMYQDFQQQVQKAANELVEKMKLNLTLIDKAKYKLYQFRQNVRQKLKSFFQRKMACDELLAAP